MVVDEVRSQVVVVVDGRVVVVVGRGWVVVVDAGADGFAGVALP